MRKSIVSNVLFLMAVGLPIVVAGTAVAAEIDTTTGLPARETETVVLPQLDDANVLWDITHGVYLNYQPSGNFSNLASLLGSAGYMVTVTDQGVDNIDLSPYCVLVLCIGSAYNFPYTASEVAAIQTFVAAGGGLLVLADNPNTPSGPNLNPVTQAFGTTVAVSYPSPNDLYFTDFAIHDIFAGINQLYFRASGALSGAAPSVEVAWTDNAETMITVVEPNQVVVTADMNFCDNSYIDIADNQTFIMNVFDWLCAGPVGAEESTWSDVKQLFRDATR